MIPHNMTLFKLIWYSISFIARHFPLWKLTGAKFNFETMFQQERNLMPQTYWPKLEFQRWNNTVKTGCNAGVDRKRIERNTSSPWRCKERTISYVLAEKWQVVRDILQRICNVLLLQNYKRWRNRLSFYKYFTLQKFHYSWVRYIWSLWSCYIT